MERVGERLRKRREEIGLTIDDIARATKYRPEIIRMIEKGATRIFPADAYLRAFIRAYAREVGLDGEDLLRMLDQERSMSHLVSGSLKQEKRRKKRWLILAITVGVAVLLGVGLLQLRSSFQQAGKQDVEKVEQGIYPRRIVGAVKITEADTSRSVGTSVESQDGSVSEKSKTRAMSQGGNLDVSLLEVVAKDSVFLTIVSGDDTLLSGNLETGDSRQVFSDKDFTIVYLSNRNAISLRLDGRRIDLPDSFGTRVRNFIIPIGDERKDR